MVVAVKSSVDPYKPTAKQRKERGFGYYQQALAWLLKMDSTLRQCSLYLSTDKPMPREMRHRMILWHWLSFSPWSNIKLRLIRWRIARLDARIAEQSRRQQTKWIANGSQ